MAASICSPVACPVAELNRCRTPFWCNEREVSRRPWLHTPNYVKMDQLLMEELPEYFPHRKLDSEYAVYMQ